MDGHQNSLTSIDRLFDTGTSSSKQKEAIEKKKKEQMEHLLLRKPLVTISLKYKELQDSAKAKGKNFAKGTLDKLIQSTTKDK
jgi:hypothetical protein